MSGETQTHPLLEIGKDLASRLATARGWSRSGERVVVPDIDVASARCRVSFTRFLDEPERKAERYCAVFGVTFVQDATLRRFEVRVRIKSHVGRDSPPHVAVYVARRKAGDESLVDFTTFKSAADYARVRALSAEAWFVHWIQAALALAKTRKLLAERGVAAAELAELALEQSCAVFTSALPGGGTFEAEDYLVCERAPKEAFAARFRAEQLPALRALLPAESKPAPVVLAPLGRSLLPGAGASGPGRPWLQLRDHHFTQRFDDQEWADFAVAVAALLDESAPIDARLDAFNRRLVDCGRRPDQKSTPVQRRSLATYFLSLADPARHLHLDATLLNRLLLKLEAPRIAPEDLTGAAYGSILDVAEAMHAFLTMRGFAPRDLLDIHGFMRIVTGHVVPTETETPTEAVVPAAPETRAEPVEAHASRQPLNVLIEGVPGVGTLERAMALAVEICDGTTRLDDDSMRRRFTALLREERICLIGLHAAFGYADFVERGSASPASPARPPDPTNPMVFPSAEPDVDVQLPSRVRDGVLKRLARSASGGAGLAAAPAQQTLRDRQIFKLSLGTALDREIEDYCLEHGVIAMGGADGVDLGTLPREAEWESGKGRITSALTRHAGQQHGRSGSVFALWTFKDRVEVGDLVLVAHGARRISAVGVVEGPYRHDPAASIGAQHFRAVRWLARDLDVPVEQLYSRPLDQQTIYALDAADVSFEALEALIGPAQSNAGAKHVLVIDGLERVDAAEVFGETALLLDRAHRIGGRAALEVTLPVSGERFALPDNLHVIATRDVRGPPLPAQFRARFRCETIEPDGAAIEGAAQGCIERGALDLRRWLATLNARLVWLVGPHGALGQAFFGHVTRLDEFTAVYRSVVLPHVVSVLGNDVERLLATLGPKLVLVDTPGTRNPLHPAAQFAHATGAPVRSRFNLEPTIADFASLYAGADPDDAATRSKPPP
jgi:hypothetical protein